jgi:flavin reductase
MRDLDAAAYRDAMARLGAAVNVVTSKGNAGRIGFTATAVCSVSDEPPTLLVCMNRRSAQHQAVEANGVLCVNILAASQRELPAVFAGSTLARGEDRFATATWSVLETGAPVLEGALASFDCVINDVIQAGTHSVFICKVVNVVVNAGDEGLVYFRRKYRSLGSKAGRHRLRMRELLRIGDS